MYEQGWKQTAIADALGVTRGAVSQWIKRGTTGGRDALRHHPPPGAAARLTAEQGRTVLVVTHDPDLAALAHRRIHLVDGRIVSDRAGPSAAA